MFLRKSVLCLVLLFLPCLAWAQDQGYTYIVKKGDTLWGISQKFIKDPQYWPNLWSNNPYVGNPHLIYPGQKIRVIDGRLEIVAAAPAVDEATTTGSAAEPAMPVPEPSITIRTLGGAEGFVTEEQLATAGTLVDTVDNRILIARGEQVFLDMADLAMVRPGDRFTLIEVGKEVLHPIDQHRLGYQVIDLGVVEIADLNPSVATGVITVAHREILRGCRLLPYQEPITEIELRKAQKSIEGYLVAAKNNQIALGQFDVVYFDIGSADGLLPGNMVNITRNRSASKFGIQDKDLELPDVLMGNAVILSVQDHSATALILKSASPIYRGDRVSTILPDM